MAADCGNASAASSTTRPESLRRVKPLRARLECVCAMSEQSQDCTIHVTFQVLKGGIKIPAFVRAQHSTAKKKKKAI